MEKIKITVTLESYSTYDLEGTRTLLEAKTFIENLEKKFEGYENLHFQVGYEGSEIMLCGTRLENDNEYNKRMKEIERKQKIQEKKKEQELRLLQRLKQKYENG